MPTELLIFLAFCVLLAVVIWFAGSKARSEEKRKQADEANERNKDIARLQAANASPSVDIVRMLKKRCK
jgi:Na+-transporting methylmalonyl-CoA/oxaloacetate decarboxylase gamma subunit